MNIKKNSFIVLGLVLGVSVILYIFDVPIVPSSSRLVPTIAIPTVTPDLIPLTLPTETQTPNRPTSISIMPLATSTVVPSTRQFTEKVDYSVRNFSESITLNMTLNGTIITDLQVSQNASNGDSASYQDAFAAEIKSVVVGKNIKDINVSAIAGASYTTAAFMQAISKIQSSI